MAAASGLTPLKAEEPPVAIDLKREGAVIITSNVIPIPLEVFAALDKLGDQDWNGQIDPRDFKPNPNRSRSALFFGLAISQGFIAVQAKNTAEVRRVGMSVQRLAGSLDVEKAVEGRVNLIMESLREKNWDAVKQELDRTRQTVLQTLKTMPDEEMASLVSLGGWLGGTGALASILKNNYSLEGADLLNQAGLLEQLKDGYKVLPSSIKSDEVFAQIGGALLKLSDLMKSDKTGTFSLAQVSGIEKETHTVLNAIYGN